MDNNHSIGMVHELKVATYFAEKGYEIYWPHAAQSRADLIVDTPEGLRKVQIKKATWSTSGPHKYLQCRLVSRNVYRREYTKGDFDIIVFSDGGDLWVVPFESVEGMTSICLTSTNPDYTPQKNYNPEEWRV